MGSDLQLGNSIGFFGWLCSLAIAVAVVIWVFWIVVFGLLVVLLLVALNFGIRWIARRCRQRRARSAGV